MKTKVPRGQKYSKTHVNILPRHKQICQSLDGCVPQVLETSHRGNFQGQHVNQHVLWHLSITKPVQQKQKQKNNYTLLKHMGPVKSILQCSLVPYSKRVSGKQFYGLKIVTLKFCKAFRVCLIEINRIQTGGNHIHDNS